MSYRVERITPDRDQPCAGDRDPTQVCNPEGATYQITRTDGRTRRMCANHTARWCHDHGHPFPIPQEHR